MSDSVEAIDAIPLEQYELVESPERASLTFHWVMLAMSSAVLIASFALNFQAGETVYLPFSEFAVPPSCGMKLFWGVDCPGCGLTRSFILLAHGDLAGSLAYNPSGILLFAVVLFQVPYRIGQLWRIRQGLPTWNLGTASAVGFSAIFAVMLIQWVVKLL
ncbi:DUF2752 domain-containing protein [Blastopirellula sp. JC732]|uniref:DUF2752 domain-containing protein n=1 Tax=Blastopirellula sediminis TaxID=2894196 RepID=A0A9X1SHC3_9BACT|nr:DUF2752 domain-containing protein [Blastopirellula sediminis]MCC9607026.1 DUF2752 domain-containing protein [Blastopirellula sediminis]MCC9629681.1 DUF2752 domain-containing protein [Blastopirellula sediminis]